MKKVFVLLLVIYACVSMQAQVSFGDPLKLNDNWLFALQDHKGAISKDYNDSGWEHVNLPHDWSVRGKLHPTFASCTGYLPGGIGWYRKRVNIPSEKQGEKVFLYFEGIYNRSEVYVNGRLLGERPNGYVSFMYDATPYIEYGKENLITVRVDHSRSADSRWYTGSGIYRNVWLVYSSPVHIAQWGVFVYPKRASEKEAQLHVDVEVANESDDPEDLIVTNTLKDATGKRVVSASTKLTLKANDTGKTTAKLNVKKPDLWSLEKPTLYTLETTVKKKGQIIDIAETKTGFRTFTFDPDKGFALNGKWMKVKGVCLHHDAGVLGSAVPREVWKRRLLTLKEIGCNAIRTSHNPQAPDLYELCDELGILVLNEVFDEWEFAKRKWLVGWNCGSPGFQGSFDFFDKWAETDLADIVRRDRNHLSVFAWSIANEVDYPNDPYSLPVTDEKSGFTQPSFHDSDKKSPNAMRLGDIAKRLVAVVKKYDLSRPTTAGLAGVSMSNKTAYPDALDIAGYNYTEGLYDQDHKTYPNRVIYGSENRHEIWTWKAVLEREFIFGQFLWTGIDYLGESGPWPSRGFYSGLVDFGGFIKPRGYFRQSLWSEKPMAYLGTYPTPGKGSKFQLKDVLLQLYASSGNDSEEKVPSTDAYPRWNYEEGQMIRVVCYTNTAKACLLLNGREVGKTKDYNSDTGIIHWDIPYASGKLEVAGMTKDGRRIANYTIQTSGRSYRLSAKALEKSVSRNKGLAHVVVEVLDEQGVPVLIADDEITCQITGPGLLLGLENSNNEDMSDYTDNVHHAFQGRLLAYIQTTGDKGDIHIRFSAPWLEESNVTITVE